MSTRTIVEINHDYWQDLEDDPDAMKKLLRAISDHEYMEAPRGIRVLRSRHHSEKIDLRIE